MTQKLKDIGEFGFIRMIRRMTPGKKGVILGIGDDAAMLDWPVGKKIVFTTDMLIENKHFRLSEATPFEIGKKAMSVNISDIAAMGGVPLYAVVSVGLRKGLSLKFVSELQKGLNESAKHFGVSIVGGDTNEGETLVINVALIGAVSKKGCVRRDGARQGDVLFVTGALGGSYASKKHIHFVPRVAESLYLVSKYKPSSMMDLSDGLAGDIHRLCEASGVGAVIDEGAIPLNDGVTKTENALSDGEDFELLFTLSPRDAARLSIDAHPRMMNFYPIGKILPKKQGILLADRKGQCRAIEVTGFDHFK